ncbi:MAG: hypothetical protein ACI8UO_001164 [Verrucomicrobiales bacterium]|jgi:hypothetical protein
MTLTFLDVALVVTAQGHNPTILHPSFLEAQDIIGRDWELADPPLCTPAISTASFKNGVRFVAEERKLQVGQRTIDCAPEDSAIASIAQKYVSALPHVDYGAVGVNFDVIIEKTHPTEYLKEKFVSEQKWIDELQPLDVGFRFSFDGNPGRLTINFDGRQIQMEGVEKSGILVRANFHKDLEEKTAEELSKVIDLYSQRLTYFKKVVSVIFNDTEDE